ncbi:MAG: pseudouridine synthase [Clostridia bacterium]|nr:pseudouridine synthase [Clostridia bacterium]
MAKARLDKIIANQFNVSRKDARIGIKQGKATVNGATIRDFSLIVDTENEITFGGQAMDYKEYIYILMNKPKGVLSATNDKSQKTVVDLVPSRWRRLGLFPVGRLDKDTTGLLIITDDGDFAHKAIAPNKNIYKTYEVTLDGAVTEEMVEAFKNGVTLADGTLCKKAILTPISENKAEIKISEGKYHQIKRMFGTVGLGVDELKRTALGGLKLPQDLATGGCRLLSDNEISLIFTSC